MSEITDQPTQPLLGSEFDQFAAGAKIKQDTLVLELHVRQPGFDRMIDTKSFTEKVAGHEIDMTEDGDDETGEDKQTKVNLKRHKTVQETIDKKYTESLVAAKNEIKSYLKKRAVKSTFLAHGMYLIPIRFFQQVDDKILEFAAELNVLVNNFESKYDEAIEDAKKNLGTAFNAEHYPTFSFLRDRYGVEARWLSLDVPKALNKINKQVAEREQEKHRVQMANAALEIREALRIEFAELTSRFAERLGMDEKTGKHKVFQHTRLDLLKEFLDMFNDKNLTSDDELNNLTKRAKEILDGVDVKSIKGDKDFRTTLEEGFAKIAEEAGKMVTVKGRKFKLEPKDG